MMLHRVNQLRSNSSKGNNNLSYNLNTSNDHVDIDSNSYFMD